VGGNDKGKAEVLKTFMPLSRFFSWSRFLESRIIGIRIAIGGPNLQKFIGIVIGDELSWTIRRRTAEESVFIDAQPYPAAHGHKDENISSNS
jgi:hypothetical protein